MTTDFETTEQYLTFVRSRFLISVLVFVSRLRTWKDLSSVYDFAIAITLARCRQRSEIQFANAMVLTLQ